MSRRTETIIYDFRGNQAIPASGSGAGAPWVKTDTSSGGSPTVGGLAGGGLRMAFDNTSEIQILTVDFGNVLSFDIDDLIRAWFIVKTVAAADSATSLAFGLTGNRHDTIDSIAQAAIFRCIANNNVLVETDDGTTDIDDVPTGLTLKANWKRFEINFAERNTTVEPPSLSKGRKSNIAFYGTNDNGSLRRVASGTRFDMSAYTGGLQPFFQLQKTADTNTDNLDILQVGIEVNLPV